MLQFIINIELHQLAKLNTYLMNPFNRLAYYFCKLNTGKISISIACGK